MSAAFAMEGGTCEQAPRSGRSGSEPAADLARPDVSVCRGVSSSLAERWGSRSDGPRLAYSVISAGSDCLGSRTLEAKPEMSTLGIEDLRGKQL